MAFLSFADCVRDLVGTPYREANCLAIVLRGLWANGIPALDPWAEIEPAWAAGWRPGDLPASKWRIVHERGPGTMLLLGSACAATGCALDLGEDLALTSRPETGAIILHVDRLDSVVGYLRWGTQAT